MLLTTLATTAKDIKTLVVTTTPQMHCATCEKKIQGNLRFERGVKRIETSIPKQTVTIQYDAEKTTPALLLKAFPKFGYEAKPTGKAGTQHPAPSTPTAKPAK